MIYNPGSDENLWTPIEPLLQTDGDISLFFMSANDIQYDNPVDDPIFKAHTLETTPTTGVPYYLSDDWVDVIGCVDQYQYCNPGHNEQATQCTSLTSNNEVIVDLDEIGLSKWQVATAKHISWNMMFSSMYYSVAGRGATALLASESVFGLDQPSLPDNQWQTELSNWFNISLARIQQTVVEYAAGPTNLGTTGSVTVSNSLIERSVCHSQKVRSGNYQNFSLLGVGIIVGVGGTLILLGICIDSCVGLIQKLLKKGAYMRLSWVLDEKLQLQRIAFEGKGWEGWEKCSESVPLTDEAYRLGTYDISKDKHPTIFKNSVEPGSSRPTSISTHVEKVVGVTASELLS